MTGGVIIFTPQIMHVGIERNAELLRNLKSWHKEVNHWECTQNHVWLPTTHVVANKGSHKAGHVTDHSIVGAFKQSNTRGSQIYCLARRREVPFQAQVM